MALVPRLPAPSRRRPLAMPTDPAAEVRTIAVELTLLHGRLVPAVTPGAVFEHLADAHHHLVRALAELRVDREHKGRHRDDTPGGLARGNFRDDADAVFGLEPGRHREERQL